MIAQASLLKPFLTDQWYVRVAPIGRKPQTKAVEDGEIQFVPPLPLPPPLPKQYENMSFQLDARHSKIGVYLAGSSGGETRRIPAWYDDAGQVMLDVVKLKFAVSINLGDTNSTRQ